MGGIKKVLIFLAFAASAESAFNATRDVYYLLYTQANPSTGQNISANVASLVSSSFNPLYPTRIVIHGWLNDAGSPIPIEIMTAYVKKGNFNVILVDWSAGANDINYPAVKGYCPSVADEIANLLRFLVANNSTDLSTLVMSGHSLGAHIAGFVGKQVSNVYAIVGLDPAGPFYTQNPPTQRLAKTDATIVQAIHTTTSFGTSFSVGTSDFWLNGGVLQPGCGLDLSCSHGRAGDYFAESINSTRFVVSGGYMGGEPLATGLSGNYYLNTNAKSPFAKG